MNAPILGRLGGISALLVSIGLAACGGGQAASSPSLPARSMAASTGSSTSAAHVRVALTNGSITGAGIYVALERGYFTQNGLDVEIVPFPGGAQMISSVAASQVEIADTDAGAGLLNAISRDLPMRFVADGSRCDQKHCGTAFVVRKELLDSGKFTDLKDLKGLTVNNFTPGSTLYQYLSRMLDKAGLKSTDLKVQNINAFTDVLAALSNGSVDASWMVEPLTTQGVEKGFLERYKNATELFGPQQNTLIVYSPEFATKQQDAGRRFMMAYVRGVRDYLDAMDAGKDYETVVSYLTKDSILKDPALYKKVGLPGFDQNAQLLLEPLKVNQQWYVDHGDVKNPVNMDQVYDPSYLQAAFDVLGTR